MGDGHTGAGTGGPFTRLLKGALALVVVALPLNLIAVQAGIGLCAILVVWGVASGRLRYRRTPLDLPLLFFLAAICASFLAAGRPIYSFFSSTSFWVFLAYFVFSQAIFATGGADALRRPLLAALAVAAAVAVFGIYQHFTGVEVAYTGHKVAHPPFSPDTFVAVAQFRRHTTLAFVLMTMLIVAVSLMLEGMGEPRLIILGLLCAPMLLGMFYTYVRMAWIGLAAALVAIGALRSWRFAAGMLAALVAAGAIAVASSPSVMTKIKMISRSGDNGRSYIWTRTAEMIQDNPGTGIGYGNFTPVAKSYYDRTPDPRMLPRCHAHNIYLHYWCETGPAGLFGFILVLTAFFMTTVPALRRAPPGTGRALLSASTALVTAIAVGSAAQDILFDGQIAFFTILFMAAGMTTARLRAAGPDLPA